MARTAPRLIRRATALAASAFLAAFALPVAAQDAAPCPADTAAALAAFADPAPGDATALALLACGEPLARERGLILIGDAEAPTPAMLDAAADALDDPAETVRQQALIALLRNPDAARPVLAARLGDAGTKSRFDPALTRADHVAVALALIGHDGITLTDAQAKRWAAIWDPALHGNFGYNSGYGGGRRDALLSSTVAEDRRAVISRACTGEYDAALECPGFDAGSFALAELTVGTWQFGYDVVAARNMLDLIAAQLRFDADEGARLLASKASGAEAETPAKCGDGPVKTKTLPDGAVVADCDDDDRPGGQLLGGLLSGVVGSIGYGISGTGPKAVPPSGRPGPPPPPPPPQAVRGPEEPALPRFPWPAPKPVRQQAISVSAVGGPNATLDQVAARLRAAVQSVDPNFETGLFSGPKGGFVLMTRIERIQDDGTPFPAPHRFTTKGNPSAGFLDSLRSLMGERPGYFRVVAFVVADTLEIDPKQPVSTIPIKAIGDAQTLPPSMGKQKLGSRKITALVYAFQRKPGQAQRPWIDGAPSALKHLQASGIGAKLGL